MFSYATKPAGRVDQFFPTSSGDAWDEFWAEPTAVPDTSASTVIASSKDPRLVTVPWPLDGMTDRTGSVAAVLAPRLDGHQRELRPARRNPKLSIDVEISGVGCFPSTATTAPPRATTAPVPCVIHVRADADTGALIERWDQHPIG